MPNDDYERSAKGYADALYDIQEIDAAKAELEARKQAAGSDKALADAWQREIDDLAASRTEALEAAREIGPNLSGSERQRAISNVNARNAGSVKDMIIDTAEANVMRDIGRITPASRGNSTTVGGPGRKSPLAFRALAVLDVVGIPLMIASVMREQEMEEAAVRRVLEADMEAIADHLRAWGFEVEVNGTRLEIEAGDLAPGTSFSATMIAEHPGFNNYYDVDISVNEDGEIEGHVRYENTVEVAAAQDIDEARFAALDITENDAPLRTPAVIRTNDRPAGVTPTFA